MSVRWVVCRGGRGRLGSGGGGRFGRVGGWGWFGRLGRGSGDGSGSVRRHGGRNGVFAAVVVVVAVVIIVIVVVVTIVLAIIIIAWNGSGSWRRGRGLDQGRRGGGRSGTSSRATVSLPVVLEGFTLLHGMAAVVEELGVVLVLTTHSNVTGVVGII